MVGQLAAESGGKRAGEGAVLPKVAVYRATSAVLVRISDCWGAPDDNCFTFARSVEAGIQWVPCLDYSGLGPTAVPSESLPFPAATAYPNSHEMWRKEENENRKDCCFENRAFPAIEIISHECGTHAHNAHAGGRGHYGGNRADFHHLRRSGRRHGRV